MNACTRGIPLALCNLQVASLAQLLPLHSPTLAVWHLVQLLPYIVWATCSCTDRFHLSCCSPIASTSAAAPQSRPPQLLLPNRFRLSCCSPIASASAAAPQSRLPQLLLPNRVRLSCCSPIASASAAAPQSLPPQLLLPNRFRLSCCSPIASSSAAAPGMCPSAAPLNWYDSY